MTKVKSLMMETCKIITILLLYCVFAATCYPSKPLNERSPDLTWQAWLLVDDQNQNQNKQQTNSDGVLRRRITPKSVFIAPTFSPESLPPCAEGYSSDPMGRCIKIIKLDEQAHYAFLVEKLRKKFGPLDYEDDVEEELPTRGPFQVNIPLGVDDGYIRGGDDDEETDIAIILSPTKPHHDHRINLDKRDSIDDENKQEMLLKKLAETTTKKKDEVTTVTEEATTSLNDDETTTMEADDLTTITDPMTMIEDELVTITSNFKRSTTDSAKAHIDEGVAPSSVKASQTQSPTGSTDDSAKAESVVNHQAAEVSRTDAIEGSNSQPITSSSNPVKAELLILSQIDEGSSTDSGIGTKGQAPDSAQESNSQSANDNTQSSKGQISASTSESHSMQVIVTPPTIITDSADVTASTENRPAITEAPIVEAELTTVVPKLDLVAEESSTPNLIRLPDESKVQKLPNSYVKFPDSDVSYQTQIPSSMEAGRHYNVKLADAPVSDRQVLFENQPLDYTNGVQTQFVPSTTHRIFNRRNRDKGLFLLPPAWRQSNFQKPLVLRFSRKHSYVDADEIKHPDYYRSVPTDDFAYLFKFKHKQLGHR